MTAANDPSRTVFDRLDEIRDLFGSVARARRRHHTDQAVERLPHLYKLMAETLVALKGEYGAALVERKIPDFFADKQAAEDFVIRKPDANSKKLRAFLDRTAEKIGIIEDEVRHLYGRPRRPNRRSAAAWAVAGLLAVTLIAREFMAPGPAPVLPASSADATAAVAPTAEKPDAASPKTEAPAPPHPDQGLIGEYFSDTMLETPFTTRRDPQIGFLWREGAPIEGFRADRFSVRWTGYLVVEKPGVYEFLTVVDDGAVLWIDDKPIIEDWNTGSLRFQSGTVSLTAGLHRIKLIYFDTFREAAIQLYWRHESEPAPELIAASSFRTRVPSRRRR